MATTYEKVVAVISKAPHFRQNNEINQLLPWFRKKSKLFYKLKTEILEDILRNCDFVSKKPDDIIILQGEQGNCFYIILRGKVTIYNLSKGDEENITQLTRDELKSDNQLDRTKLGNFVCHLTTGDPFGEVALLSKDCIRTASVVAEENIDLMVVEKSLYERSVRDVLTKEFQQKIAFICANPLFRDWPHKYRHQLAMAVYKIVLAYNEELIAQGEATTCIYFVLKGQLEILCNPKQHVSQYPKLVLPEITDTRSKILKKQNIKTRYKATFSDQ